MNWSACSTSAGLGLPKSPCMTTVTRSPGPVFSRIMGYVLGRYGVEPTGGKPSRLPVEW